MRDLSHGRRRTSARDLASARGLGARARRPRRVVRKRVVPDTALQMVDPRHILVGLLCPIGDTLFATPALAALRRRFPRARITALVYRSNAGILAGNPNVDACVLAAPGDDVAPLVRLARGVGMLQHGDYDLMVSFSPAASFVGWLAGVPRGARLIMPRHWWLLGGRNPDYRRRHAVDHYLDVVRPLLTEEVSDEERLPRVYLARQDRAAARRILRANGLSPANLLVAMHVGGEGFGGRKRWSTERFAAVGRHLVETFGARVLLLGGPADLPLAAEVAAEMPRGAVVLAGQTSLLETAALVERSVLFVGNDSCPLHIAAAVGTPTVGIYGPSSVEQFHPIGPGTNPHRVLSADLPCGPCFQFVGNTPPWVPNACHSYACLKAIRAEQVIEAAAALLADTTRADTTRADGADSGTKGPATGDAAGGRRPAAGARR
jgi:ADP-heptose:LPS heptosyltransferase